MTNLFSYDGLIYKTGTKIFQLLVLNILYLMTCIPLITIGAANTIDRIIDAFPEQQQYQIRVQLAMVLRAIVSQQLIPAIDGGVIPAFEVMFVNSAIRNMIRESKIHQIDNVIFSSGDENMISMDTSIYNLYKAGKISTENALNYSVNKKLMEKKLNL